MANHTLNENYNGKTMLRKWWPIVRSNFNNLLLWLTAHLNGTADRHKAEDIDYSSSQTVKQKIDSEVQNRQSADSALQSSINTEISERQNAINAEAAARQNADSAEANARQDAITSLGTTLGTRITNEENARQEAVTSINTRISNEENIRKYTDKTFEAQIAEIVEANELTENDLKAEVLVEDGYLLPISVVSRNGNEWSCKIDLSSIELKTKLFCRNKSDWGVGEYTFDITAEAEGETFQVYLEVNTIRGTSDVWVEKAAHPPFPSMVDVDGTMQFWICQFIIEAYDSNSPELDINNCTEHETVDLRELIGYHLEHCKENEARVKEELAGKAPKNHISTTKEYGGATGVDYGHVMLCDTITDSYDDADSVAATPKAVKKAYDKAESAMNLAAAPLAENIAITSANASNLDEYIRFVDGKFEAG